MRNLREYPLTLDEACEILSLLNERDKNNERIGDMTDYTVSTIRSFLKRHGKEFEDFCKIR